MILRHLFFGFLELLLQASSRLEEQREGKQRIFSKINREVSVQKHGYPKKDFRKIVCVKAMCVYTLFRKYFYFEFFN